MTEFYSGVHKAFVSVDCIIFGFEDNKLKLLLGKRQMDPGRGEWALYGGFVGTDESVDEAAHRVLCELTGLKNIYMKQVHTFGAIDRDPGERVISVAYCALINVKDYDESLLQEHGVQWVELNKIPPLYSDHNEMVKRAISMLRRRINTEPLSFNLLPDLFTLTQLQHVYEAVLGEEIDKRNFRKRIKSIDFIEKTELIDKVTSKRGAALYRFNKKMYLEDPSFKL
jgi:ADP-ribose pyrophosphatase YjhB (NUDIX family)